MKKLVTTMFLICAAMLLFSPQAGFAYQNVNQGCLTCHPTTAGTGLHTVPHIAKLVALVTLAVYQVKM